MPCSKKWAVMPTRLSGRLLEKRNVLTAKFPVPIIEPGNHYKSFKKHTYQYETTTDAVHTPQTSIYTIP